jgi:hypothetical protein
LIAEGVPPGSEAGADVDVVEAAGTEVGPESVPGTGAAAEREFVVMTRGEVTHTGIT